MTYDDFLKETGKLLDLNWRKYRRRSARRHVEERLRELGLEDYSQYLERLRRDPEEAGRLPERMRVTVSRFFREKECWGELAEKVLPQLLKDRSQGTALRVWSIGCCNGEEPYSLAILLLSSFAAHVNSNTFEILATDIDEEVLARAHEGCYENGSLREVPTGFLGRFFILKDHWHCVVGPARSMVRFERQNFMEDSLPPQEFDLVLCRYLAFTYYRGDRQYRAAQRLWSAIRPGGALMIGRKEELGLREEEFFEHWPGAGVTFRRK